MKLKNIKKHVKKVKLTMKFDSIEAANSMHKRLRNIVDDTAMKVPNSYIRIERWEKKPKIVVTASGREIMDEIF